MSAAIFLHSCTRNDGGRFGRPEGTAHRQLRPSGPDLHGDHGLLGADGGQQVLLAQELKRELHHEAVDLLQLLLGPGGVLLLQARLGQVALQLQDVPDVTGWQATENLEGSRRSQSSERQQSTWRNRGSKRQRHLLVNGGVPRAGGHPDLLVEVVADGVQHVDGGVRVSSQNGSEETRREKQSSRRTRFDTSQNGSFTDAH